MNEQDMALFTEKKAVHNALLELGFVYLGQNNLYILHTTSGDVPLSGSLCTCFGVVIQRLGAVYFNTRFATPALRKVHHKLSQDLVASYRVWEDLQVIRHASNLVKKNS
jgi:hypothetical protein